MNTGHKGDVQEMLPNLSKVYSVAVVIIMLMMLLFDPLPTPTPLALPGTHPRYDGIRGDILKAPA